MNQNLSLTKQFHERFEIPISNQPAKLLKERYEFRYQFLKEEIEEYLEAAQEKELDQIAKELCDIQCVLYGAVLEHGLQEKFDEMYEEVMRSNMSKEKSGFKMVKGEEYKKADLKQFLN